jgi:hypothetical protein
MTFPIHPRYKLLLWGITFLVFGIAVISGLVALIPDRGRIFYSSDVLYLPALYRDLLSGARLSDWGWPPAPYILPDMLLFFALNTIVPNFHIAIVLNAVAQLCLFVAGLLFISFTINREDLAVHLLILPRQPHIQ